ncbi:SHOCT domain-containing protein [Actinocrispum wychmicini]|uniref:SHOCT domain-containing protein n=1 Tax=Actinocrispum wychmicini TaxID=1213861 RepID=UPI001FB7C012|nr:SHOCT domain-containing protein [Actinocrispum wychmicini]
MGPGWLGWLFTAITTIVFLGGLVTLGVIVVRQLRRAGPAKGESTEEILVVRFARGEIDEEEYRRRWDALRQ